MDVASKWNALFFNRLWSTYTDVDTGHDTDTSTPVIISENELIEHNQSVGVRH